MVTGHLLVAVADDRRHALVARQTRSGHRGSFHALVLRADALPLVLVEVAVPLASDRWEFRSSGLWVEAVCEDPGSHWSYGLEAFALAIDRPDELAGRGYGHRTPLGWELDFVSGRGAGQPGQPVDSWPESQDGVRADPTIEVGSVEGLLLTAPAEGGEQPFSGAGWRVSLVSSRPDPWPATVPAPSGHPIEVALPLDGVGTAGPLWWVGHDGESLTSRLAAVS